MAGDFYARNSWDYLIVRPLVVKYLLKHSGDDRYPLVISDTQLYDDISSQGVARFGANRLFHCISRVLRELGYERRSRRGRTWDRVGELEFIPELSPSALRIELQLSCKHRLPTRRKKRGMRSPPTQFYPGLTEKRYLRLYPRGREKGLIDAQEEADLREYIQELRATRHIKIHRVVKTTSDLIYWKRFLKTPYHKAKIKEVHAAVSAMMAGTTTRGEPFKQNTKHDWVKALRAYLLWLIENGKSGLEEKQVRKIKVPPRDYQTTMPHEILTNEEVNRLILAGNTSRDRALVAVLYETGSRVGELYRMKWMDLKDDDPGIAVTIRDEKTGVKIRHSKVIKYSQLVATWRMDHPGGKDPEALVFIDSKRGRPLTYDAMRYIIRGMAERAGIEKRVHPHLFRKVRVTHMLRDGYSETTIKKSVWNNLDTRVLKTYGVLADEDIDAELEEKAGVAKKARPRREVQDRPRVCPNCNHINVPTNEFCGKCMAPLTEEAISHREQLIRDVIQHWDVIPEAYQRMQTSKSRSSHQE